MYQSEGADVAALHIDYGQPARAREWEAAKDVARHFAVPLRRLRIGALPKTPRGEYLGRNAMFVLTAASSHVRFRPLVIAMGLHDASPYYDTTKEFVADMQRVLDGYFGGTVALAAPFIGLTKAHVVRLAKRYGVPVDSTHSCQHGEICGECSSCLDRRALGVD